MFMIAFIIFSMKIYVFHNFLIFRLFDDPETQMFYFIFEYFFISIIFLYFKESIIIQILCQKS